MAGYSTTPSKLRPAAEDVYTKCLTLSMWPPHVYKDKLSSHHVSLLHQTAISQVQINFPRYYPFPYYHFLENNISSFKFQSVKMKLHSATAFLLAAAASTTLAAPTPSALERRQIQELYPDFTSQYNVGTGAITYNTGQGLISKSPTNGGQDITTLVTFNIPAAWSSYSTCRIVFTSDSTSSVSGSGRADVFTSISPAQQSTASWPPGNLRDVHVGRLLAAPGTEATWEQTYVGPDLPCAEIAGRAYGGELVGVYDTDYITWTPGTDGIKIVVVN
jgi:Ubiquitin 3 binding protein But2 C-terminal domain